MKNTQSHKTIIISAGWSYYYYGDNYFSTIKSQKVKLSSVKLELKEPEAEDESLFWFSYVETTNCFTS